MIDASQKAILTAFTAGWIGDDALPVEYPNQKFKEPKGEPWARIAVLWGNRKAAAIGRGRVRAIGVLAMQIFLPEDDGTAAATAATDLLAEIFDAEVLTVEAGLVVVFNHVSAGAPLERDGYVQINADVDFRADKTT